MSSLPSRSWSDGPAGSPGRSETSAGSASCCALRPCTSQALADRRARFAAPPRLRRHRERCRLWGRGTAPPPDAGSARSIVLLDSRSPAGTLKVAAAARPWERLGEPVKLGWFPPADAPVVLASPAPGTLLMPTSRLRLTFSTPVDAVFGSARPSSRRPRRVTGGSPTRNPRLPPLALRRRLRRRRHAVVAASGRHRRTPPRDDPPPVLEVRPASTAPPPTSCPGRIPSGRLEPEGEARAPNPAGAAGCRDRPARRRLLVRYPNTPPELRAGSGATACPQPSPAAQ